jgi:hypothetical protein
MQEAVQELLVLARAWASSSEVALQGNGAEPTTKGTGIEEVEWRIKSIEFQDALRMRDSRVRRLERTVCVGCPDFDEHVSLPHVLIICVRLTLGTSIRHYINNGRSKAGFQNSSFS